MPILLQGVVTYKGKGLKGVTVSLVPIIKGGGLIVPLPKNTVTDDNGRYAFTVEPENTGKNYKITPKYKDLAAGTYFSPQNKTFTLNGNQKIDFVFYPPDIKVKGIVKTQKGIEIPGVEMTLEELTGPQQYKFLAQDKTSNGGFFNFELDYTSLDKEMRLRPRHPKVGAIGENFAPSQRLFNLTGDVFLDFIYNGPLADLMVSKAQLIPNGDDPEYMIFTITNQGGLAAGPFAVELSYNEFDVSTYENPYKTTTRTIDGLAAGASQDLQFWFPVIPQKKNRLKRLYVDRNSVVTESDKMNNKYPPEAP